MNTINRLFAETKPLRYAVYICLSFIFAACTSPTQLGEELGNKYCDGLTGYEGFESLTQFRALKDSIEASVHDEYEKYTQKFAKNSVKLNKFLTAYDSVVAPKNADFEDTFENLVRTILNKKAWYKEKDPSKYYLYSLAEDSLNVLNCKEKISYTLHWDTIFFSDNDHTTAIVDFIGDTIMSLTNANDTSYASTYRVAEFEDLIRGTWTYRTYQNLKGRWRSSWTTFKENGRYVGQEWQNNWYVNTSGTYKFQQVDDTTYRLITDNGRNGLNGKIVVKNVDQFRHYYRGGSSEVKKRRKNETLKALDCLFEQTVDKK